MKPRCTYRFFASLLSVSLVIAAHASGKAVNVRASEANKQLTVFLPLLTRQNSAVSSLPSFEEFVASVTNGEASAERGVYVPGVLALAIQQQPAGDTTYIAPTPQVVTQFQSAAYFGVTGLLAHNTLAGAEFFNLSAGQEVRIVFGDGTARTYQVRAIRRYQALDPNNASSSLIDLDTGAVLSALDVFNQMYTGPDHVTFQTCIRQDGIATWGRLFVTALPIS